MTHRNAPQKPALPAQESNIEQLTNHLVKRFGTLETLQPMPLAQVAQELGVDTDTAYRARTKALMELRKSSVEHQKKLLAEARLENRHLRAANSQLTARLVREQGLWAMELLTPLDPMTREQVYAQLIQLLDRKDEAAHLGHELYWAIQQLRGER